MVRCVGLSDRDCFKKQLFWRCEEVGENDIEFSYKIMKGPATSQNAVKLLEFAGFPEEIIEAAQE